MLLAELESGPAPLPDSGVRSTLSGSLQTDISRFIEEPQSAELLPILAASMRHARCIAMVLAHEHDEVYLSIDPRTQSFESDVDLLDLPDAVFRQLRLRQLDDGAPLSGAGCGLRVGRLGDLVWRAALAGSRADLLPEIAGRVMYRVPGRMPPPAMAGAAALHAMAARLNGPPATLAELQKLGSAELAQRLLNGLYLKSALIVTRAGLPRALRQRD